MSVLKCVMWYIHKLSQTYLLNWQSIVLLPILLINYVNPLSDVVKMANIFWLILLDLVVCITTFFVYNYYSINLIYTLMWHCFLFRNNEFLLVVYVWKPLLIFILLSLFSDCRLWQQIRFRSCRRYLWYLQWRRHPV